MGCWRTPLEGDRQFSYTPRKPVPQRQRRRSGGRPTLGLERGRGGGLTCPLVTSIWPSTLAPYLWTISLMDRSTPAGGPVPPPDPNSHLTPPKKETQTENDRRYESHATNRARLSNLFKKNTKLLQALSGRGRALSGLLYIEWFTHTQLKTQ